MTLDLFDDLYDDSGLDRVLASGLSALAPEPEPVDVLLAELRPRFRRARTRRRVARASAALAAVFVVGGSIALAASPSTRRAHVTVESPAAHTEATKTPKPATRHVRVKAIVPKPKQTVPPATVTPHTSPSLRTSDAPAPSAPAVAATTNPPTAATTPPHKTSRPPTVAALPKPVRYRSLHGSIYVRFARGRMTLVHVAPDAGYHRDIEVNRPLHIDVMFSRAGHRSSEIELRVVNGKVVQVDDRISWDWSGVSSVSPIAKHPAGEFRVGLPPGAGGRLTSAPIDHGSSGKKNGHDQKAGASV